MKRRSEDDSYDPSKEIISGPSYAMLLEGLKDEATQGVYDCMLNLMINDKKARIEIYQLLGEPEKGRLAKII